MSWGSIGTRQQILRVADRRGLDHLSGAGVAAPVEDGGADRASALSVSLGHQRGKHVLSLRGVAAFELFGDDYFDVGLLYGRTLSSGVLFASAGAGLGAVFGTRGSGGVLGGGKRNRSARG